MMTISKHILIVASAVFIMTACSKKDGNSPDQNKNTLKWEKMGSFPGCIRMGGIGFWVGENFYTGFGVGYVNDNFADLELLNDLYEYNSVSKIWTKKSDFPNIGRTSAAAFCIGNKGYVCFGVDMVRSVYYNDIWEYDPATDRWAQTGTYDQVSQGFEISSFVVNGKAYMMFNYELWVFDPSDKSMTKIGQVPDGLIFSTGFVLNDKIYVGTGGTPELLKTFYEFDPLSNTWTKKADFQGSARRYASGFALNGKGYITCGQITKQLTPNSYQWIGAKDTWQYDPEKDSWIQFNDYPGDAFIHQVSSCSGARACVGTGDPGETINYGKDFWLVSQ